MKGLGLLSAPLDDQGLTTQHYSLFNETKCTFISSSYVSNLTVCRFWREQRGLRGLLRQQLGGQESCRRGEDRRRRRDGQERRSRGGECRPHNCHFFLHKYNLWYLWQMSSELLHPNFSQSSLKQEMQVIPDLVLRYHKFGRWFWKPMITRVYISILHESQYHMYPYP